ncbi:MAG: MFS transporter [candidate division Zixibacteria bacterium]|nr:MFS transporter [candidate division Zixibacteria bacterium]
MSELKMDVMKPAPGKNITGRIKSSFNDYLAHLRLFSRNARLFLTGMFLVWINFQIFNVLFNLYLKEFGFNESQIGLINSSRGFGMTLMAIPAAILLNRIRLKPVLLTGSILLAIFSFVMCTFVDFFVIVTFSVLNGMMLAFFSVASGPFFMRNSTIKERTYLFSASFAVMVLSGMAASAGSGEIVTFIGKAMGNIIEGFQYTLYLGIIISLFALIPVMKIQALSPSDEERRLSITWRQFKERGSFYFKISFANFIVGLGAGLIIPFLNLYFRDRFSLPPDTIGWFFFSVTAAMFIGALAGPVLAKKLGLVRTVVITQLLSIPFMLILAYSYTLPLVFMAFVLRGGLMNMGSPIVNNMSMELSRKDEQGLVNALLMVTWTASWMVATAVGGYFINHFGYTFTMNITMVLYVISSVTYYSFFKKTEEKSDTSLGWSIIRKDSL